MKTSKKIGDFEGFLTRVREMEEGYDLIVRIAQRYEHETDFRESNQLFLWDCEKCEHYWLSDWHEGEEYFGIVGYDRVEDIYLW